MRFVPALLLLLAAGPASAQTDRELVERGEWLARQWCSACHVTSATAPGSRNDAAPSFPAIAGRAGVTAGGLSTYIRIPHANMPDHGLTARQAQELAAYILAQKPR